MKKLTILIALAFVVTLVVPALALDLDEDIEVSGSVEVRGFSNDNLTDQLDTVKAANDDEDAEWQTRFTLGIDADLAEDITGKVVLTDVTNAELGQYVTTTTGAVAGTGTAETGQDLQNDITLTQAYIKVADIVDVEDWTVNLTFGRQNVGAPGDLVLYYGPVADDPLTVNYLDTLKLDVNIVDIMDLTVLSGKAAETVTGNSGGDINVFGLVASTAELVPDGVLKGYYYRRLATVAVGSDDDDNRGVYGVAVNGAIEAVEGLGYKAELAFNTGDNAGNDYDGDALILGVSYERAFDLGDLGVSLDYAAGSGNDAATATKNEAWTPIASDIVYGAVLNNGTFATPGTTAAPGRSIANLKVIALGATFTPAPEEWTELEKLTFGLTYLVSIDFDELTAADVTAGRKDDIGSEIDLSVAYALTDALSLKALYGVLSPGDYFLAAAEDSMSVMRLEMALTF